MASKETDKATYFVDTLSQLLQDLVQCNPPIQKTLEIDGECNHYSKNDLRQLSLMFRVISQTTDFKRSLEILNDNI